MVVGAAHRHKALSPIGYIRKKCSNTARAANHASKYIDNAVEWVAAAVPAKNKERVTKAAAEIDIDISGLFLPVLT